MSTLPAPDQLRAYLQAEYNRPFEGWNFSYLAGRRVTIRPSDTWDYTAAITAAIRNATSMLDMDTGGGEFLAALPARAPKTCASEGYAPNVTIARRRLAPLGIEVVAVADASALPFAGEQFDLVTNRHGAYAPRELRRVIEPGGLFITQQIGSQTNRVLHELLGDLTPAGAWGLARAARELEAVGFQVLEQGEEFPITRYFDVGAIVYYLKAVAWEIPDFTVDRYFDKLVEIHRRIQAEGHLDVNLHQFFIKARRP